MPQPAGLVLALISCVLIQVSVEPHSTWGQSAESGSNAKPHARAPKEIAFQNDRQWEDNRWQKTDVGPFLAATISAGKGLTLKGLAIRVGDQGQASVLFDTARMRMAVGWTGDFLSFSGSRFGLIRPPAAGGKIAFTNQKLAGWAMDDRFAPELSEVTDPVIDASYGGSGTSETRLPKDWSWYRGHYTSGNRVVLSYTVGACEVLESPWFLQSEKHHAFERTFEIGPCLTSQTLMLGDSKVEVQVIGDDSVSLIQRDGHQLAVIAPHSESVLFKILVAPKSTTETGKVALLSLAGQPSSLSRLIHDDSGRFPESIVTKGERSKDKGPYVIDTITLPFENPWNALLFTAGHDFFGDGSAAICTAHGDVWTVDGIDDDLRELRWRRFATGLHQPLGLRIVDDKIYVIGKNQITRLHDRNGDGEADFYENFNNDQIISPRSHDYVTCLDTDSEGNFYFIHAKTGVMKVSADGGSLAQIADGFRNPNGMGVSPGGVITAAPQQGGWTPESSLIVVQKDGYYGFPGPRVTNDRPTGWDLPMCFIPRAKDNSGGGQTWVQGDRWGPLSGKMLHLSYGQCRLLLALVEQVDDNVDRTVFQGGTIEFPTEPGDFESGIMRGRFSPHDGQLYVSGLRGWQTRAIRDGCFQRVRYTGGEVNLPVDVSTYANGIELKFTEPLDRSFAQRPENYFAQQWNYRWSGAYGSPDFSVTDPDQQGRDEVEVISATVTGDGTGIFLEMPGLKSVHQIQLTWLMRSKSGKAFRGEYAHTINVDPTNVFPESQIIRQARPRFVSIEVEKRLKPGLESIYHSDVNARSDRRVDRLVALHQPLESTPTPFLPDGPFRLSMDGTLKIPLSGMYEFRLESNGRADLQINGQAVMRANEPSVPQSVLLFKGHNQIRVGFQSPTDGTAELRLLWKGDDFDWEPVPPNVLFHDSGSKELVACLELREGRELFASRHCGACHRTGNDIPGMFELTLDAPDLHSAAERFRPGWLQQWILSPSSFRPGTSMPAVLGTGEKARKDASDIVAFLLQQSDDDDSREDLIAADQNSGQDSGEEIYEQQACMTCHHFEPAGEEDDFGRLSLNHANEKFKPGALAAFLDAPMRHHGATRMPHFGFSTGQTQQLASYIRQRAKAETAHENQPGDPSRGRKLFQEKGCNQCHEIKRGAKSINKAVAFIDLDRESLSTGCFQAHAEDPTTKTPRYDLTPAQRSALSSFVGSDRKSLARSSATETSRRLFKRLQCNHCHDRDGIQSHRRLVVAEEGSGQLPESIPQLTWSGEKLRPEWTQSLFHGTVSTKTRPWLKAAMPAFPAYAEPLSNGLSLEHGLEPKASPSPPVETSLAKIGQQLTLQTGLDCRQCHGIGDQQPRGDKDTAIALGINFVDIRERMRHESYKRFMLDPPRYDVKTRMIRLSNDGMTTKLKTYFHADARQQFDAVWHYIQSLPEDAPANE